MPPEAESTTARNLKKTVVGSFFNGGVRIYSIADPYAATEIGFIVDAPPKANATRSIQINDVCVDENRLIYANDRLSGGLDIIRYTGSVPLESIDASSSGRRSVVGCGDRDLAARRHRLRQTGSDR